MSGIKSFALGAKKLLTDCLKRKILPDDEAEFSFLSCALAIHYMKLNNFLCKQLIDLEFAKQCNELCKIMPDFFKPILKFSEVNFPVSELFLLLDEIDNEVFIGRPEVIGQVYQHYISDLKDETFSLLQSNIRITKERLPAATQIFTPMWIVKYLVENSLGELSGIKNNKWEFYINQTDIQINNDAPKLTLIDPCMGSGNILLYAFDVFMDIYTHMGYNASDAAKLILENNLFGLDIDDKAYRLAYFSLMMKARSYDDKIFDKPIRHNLCAIEEDEGYFKGAKEFGSLLCQSSMPNSHNLQRQADIMSRSYDAVVTNPPYMGRKSLNPNLADFLRKNYPESKSELYAAFILACVKLTKNGGICAMVTLHTWLFISSFAALRSFVLQNTSILSVLHSGAATFEGVSSFNALAAAFCLRKEKADESSVFIRLTDYLSADEKQKNFRNPKNIFKVNQKKFIEIPNNPFVYMVSDSVSRAFLGNKSIGHYAPLRQGLATGDNKSFVKFWHEVDKSEIAFSCESISEFHETGKKFAPYNKGGNHRKWYGGNEYVIAFDQESFEKLSRQGNRLPSRQFYFKEGITWSLFGFENFSVRYKPCGFVFDVSGSSMFPEENMEYMLGYLSSKAAFLFLSSIAPTVNFQVGNIASLPFVVDDIRKDEVERLVRENIEISKQDWDSFEASWDFNAHPLAKKGLLCDSFEEWSMLCKSRYDKLKANEERINQIFIEIFGLKKEISPTVAERDIAIKKADLKRDVKSIVSYATGCFFGRYGGERVKTLTFEQLTDKFIGFAEQNLGNTGRNLEFIAKALGVGGKSPKEAILRYYSRDFYKEHFKAYKKHPIYYQEDNGIYRKL